VDLLKHVSDRFNARDMKTVLAATHDDVIWANGMEGGHVRGRDEVRRYWTRQWTRSRDGCGMRRDAHCRDGCLRCNVHRVPFSIGDGSAHAFSEGQNSSGFNDCAGRLAGGDFGGRWADASSFIRHHGDTSSDRLSVESGVDPDTPAGAR